MMQKIKESLKKEVLKTENRYKAKKHKKSIKKALKKERRKSENYSWVNAATLLTNIMALSVYCSISPAIAEYQGKQMVFYSALGAIIVMTLILLGEIYSLIKHRGYDYLVFLEKLGEIISRKKRQILCRLLIAICLGGTFIIYYYNHGTVKCYKSVVEVYGIPEGVGQELGEDDRKSSTGYWEIETFKHKKCIILTYVEPYHQLELMQKNSTAYGTCLFRPTSKIIYEFEKDKEYYFSQDQNVVENMEKRKFWVTKDISYYSSSGKLLLKLEKNKQNRLEVTVYSPDDTPQLLNSTLLRIPDGDTVENGILSQQIETVYNLDGLPQMRRFTSGVNNPYGANGECYIYDQEKRLTALHYINNEGEAICNKSGIMQITFQYDDNNNIEWLRYYSDEKGVEKIEGFYGVCCENLEYDERGRLIERRQMNRGGHSWYDANGVSIYQYDYEEGSGRLKKETYLDRLRAPVRDKNNHCFWCEFDQQEKGEVGNREILVSYDRQESQVEEEEMSEEMTDFSEQGQHTFYAPFYRGEKQIWETFNSNDLQTEKTNDKYDDLDRASESMDSSWNKEREGEKKLSAKGIGNLGGSNEYKEEKLDFIRNYITICYTIGKDGCVKDKSYCDENGKWVVNEDGYAGIRYEYDSEHRITVEAYLDKEGSPCSINGGYAKIIYTYAFKEGSELNRVEYLNADMETTFNSELGYAYVKYDRQYQGKQKRIIRSYYDVKETGEDGEKLVLLPDLGYAVEEQLYDENGLLIQVNYRDKFNIPTSRTDYGVAEILYEYAEDGNMVCAKYKDIDGNPINRTDRGYAVVYQKYEDGKCQERWFEGYQNHMFKNVPDRTMGCAKIRYMYNNGKKIREQYFDVEDMPVLRSDIGCASQAYKYNDRGELEGEYFYDTEDNLVLRSDTGYAVAKYEYNKDGKYLSERYYGLTEGNPVISTKYHCAGFKYDYDERGNRTDTWYIDIDEGCMIRPDLGYAHVKSVYDEFGNEKTISYFDEKELPVARKEGGYVKCEKTYYSNGNLKDIRYLNDKDELVMRNDKGYAVVEYQYDDYNRTKSVRYKDQNDYLVINTEDKCAGYDYIYEENQSTTCYIGLDGKPMFRKDYGFVQIQTEKVGNIKRDSYLDKNGTPAIWREGGFSECEEVYENGNKVEERYFDKEGNPIMRKDVGYSFDRYQYDEYGKCVSDLFYNKEGNPTVSTKYCCAGFEYAYDDQGNRTDIWYLDINGDHMIRSDLGYAHVQSEYDALGNEIKIAYYDADENLIERKEGGYAIYENKYENGDWIESRYYDAEGKSVMRNDKGYAIVKNEYEEHKLISQRYFDTDGKPVISTKYYCAGYQYAYDEFGNETDLWYIDVDGNRMIREDTGCSHIKREYDNLGREIRITYYDMEEKLVINKEDHCAGFAYAYNGFGDYTDIWYIAVDGDAEGDGFMVRGNLGFAHVKYEYDKFGQETKRTYYGVDNKPIISSKYHCAGCSYYYDEKGNLTDVWYLGPDEKPMVKRDLGYAHANYKYDDFGKIEKAAFFGAREEKAVEREKGCASWEKGYENGLWNEERYYNIWGEPMLMKGGYAIVKNKYDEHGRCISQLYYDMDDNPVISSVDHCAGFCYVYDEKGNQTDIKYLGLDGEPMVRGDLGYAQIRFKYDDLGNVVRETYHDENGEPIISTKYCCAGMIFGYDKQGNRTDVWYLELEGKVMTREELGYAHIRYEYDAWGNEVKMQYYDENEVAVFGIKDHCVGFRYAYDVVGNRTDTWYLGLDEEVIVREDLGYAHIHSEYDEFGNEEKIYYLDVNEELAVCKGAEYAFSVNKFKNGNLIEKRYYDTNGRLILRKDEGCAIVKWEYDEYGQRISILNCGIDEAPVVNKKYHYVGVTFEYDQRGNETDIYYHGLDGEDVLSERRDYGVAYIKNSYDIYNNYIGEKYYDEDLKLAIRKDLGYARIKREYYDNGRLASITYYDEKNQYIDIADGYAKIGWDYDEWGNAERYTLTKNDLMELGNNIY